jgi:glycosyltransferase involved in cell wall biosynthesis
MSDDIIYLSRFNTFCGISTYTEQLAEAISKGGFGIKVAAASSDHVQVIHEQERGMIPSIASMISWKEDGSLSDTADMLLERNPKVVHIQHEFSIFRDSYALIQLCRTIRDRSRGKIKLILTAHSVPRCGVESIGKFSKLIRAVDAVIVHSPIAKRAIGDYAEQKGIPTVRVIPHGMLVPQNKWKKSAAQHELGLPNNKNLFVILVLGFIAHYKKHVVLLQLLEAIRQKGMVAPTKVFILIAGMPQPQGKVGEILVGSLKAAAQRKGLSDSIMIVPGFVPFDELPVFYGAADMTLHAYAAKYHSSSGSIRTDLSYGMPVMAQYSLITQDLPKDTVMLFNKEGDALNKLFIMITKRDRRQGMAERAIQMAKRHAWPNTALTHIKLYESLTGYSLRNNIRISLLPTNPFAGR